MKPIRSFLHLRALAAVAAFAPCAAVLGNPQLSPPTTLPGDLTIAPSAGDQSNVAIARGAGQSLMVWEDTRAALVGTVSTGGYGVQPIDLFAARLDANGALLDTSPIRVSTATFQQHGPKVAWNGANYLVVWTSRRAQQFSTTEGIYAARVAPSGQVLDDPPLLINDDDSIEEMFPVVASDGVDWAVAWNDQNGFDPIVGGCIVSAAGSVGQAFTLFTAPVPAFGLYTPTNMELAFGAGRYLFVSEHYRYPNGNGWEIFGQLFTPGLGKIGGEFPISGVATGGGVLAAVASNGIDFGVVWASAAIRGTPVRNDGTVVVPGGLDLSPGIFLLDPHPAVAWDGANWLAAYELGNPVEAARFSNAGAAVGGPFTIDAAAVFAARPVCVTIAGGAAVVWSESRNQTTPFAGDLFDLYGSFVSSTGAATPLGALSVSPPAQVHADIAGSAASGYLVVFESVISSGTRIVAQRVDAQGQPLDPEPFEIASGARTLHTPAVAWNGAEWLVVWEEFLGGIPGSTANVWGRRVLPDGTVLDAAPILILPGNTPDVAALGDTFLVVSSNEPFNHFKNILGRRVRGSDGAMLDASPLVIGGTYALVPSVAALSDRWLIAWQRHSTHDNPPSDIRANIVLANGAVQVEFIAGNATSVNKNPSTAFDGAQALIAWGDGANTRAGRVTPAGGLVDTSTGFVLSNAPNVQFAPDVGWDGVEYLAVWNDYRANGVLEAGIGDLFATRIGSNATVLDPAGLAVANDPAVPESNPAVAGELGKVLVAFSPLNDQSPYGTFRITLRGSIDGPIQYCTAKTNSLGCTPAIGFSGSPSASAGSGFVIDATQVLANKPGLLCYSVHGSAGAPFQDGTLCVAPPIKRTAVQTATASGAQPCTGVYAYDFNVRIASGVDPTLIAGQQVWSQYWSRDTGVPSGTGLTNGLTFTIAP